MRGAEPLALRVASHAAAEFQEAVALKAGAERMLLIPRRGVAEFRREDPVQRGDRDEPQHDVRPHVLRADQRRQRAAVYLEFPGRYSVRVRLVVLVKRPRDDRAPRGEPRRDGPRRRECLRVRHLARTGDREGHDQPRLGL